MPAWKQRQRKTLPLVALISWKAVRMGRRGSSTRAFHIASSSSWPCPVGSIRSSGVSGVVHHLDSGGAQHKRKRKLLPWLPLGKLRARRFPSLLPEKQRGAPLAPLRIVVVKLRAAPLLKDCVEDMVRFMRLSLDRRAGGQPANTRPWGGWEVMRRRWFRDSYGESDWAGGGGRRGGAPNWARRDGQEEGIRAAERGIQARGRLPRRGVGRAEGTRGTSLIPD